jgi:hypothetical protein
LDRRKVEGRRKLIRQGEDLQRKRCLDSGYGDLQFLTGPQPIETPQEILPIGYINVVDRKDKDTEALATMRIYNGHKLVPREGDFFAEITELRTCHKRREIMYFGCLATEQEGAGERLMFTLIMRKVIIFFMESNVAAGFIVVNPKHKNFYSRIGFVPRGFIECAEGLTNAPGVYMEVVKGETVNATEVNRVIWRNKYKNFKV